MGDFIDPAEEKIEQTKKEFDIASYINTAGKEYWKWLLGLIILGLLVWFIPGGEDTADDQSEKTPADVGIAGEKKDVNLYLSDKNKTGLIIVGITVELGGAVDNKIESVLETLFDENRKRLGALPSEIIVRTVFVQNNEAVISLDGAFQRKFKGGAWTELLAVYSLVNSVVDNFEDIYSARILIDDKETDFFVNHVDVQRALTLDSSFILEESSDT